MKDKEKPSRWQAKVWADTVLEPIIGGKWFDSEDYSFQEPAVMLSARQIGVCFPEFIRALVIWMDEPTSSNEKTLKCEAENVFLSLSVPDVHHELNAAEEEISRLEAENAMLKDRLENRVSIDAVSSGSDKISLDPTTRAAFLLAAVDLETRLKSVSGALEEQDRLRNLLKRSIRVESVDFDGEKGCRFILGEDHVVAEWRGDGIASDTVFLEKPSLEYGVTTTSHIRCMRMAFEMAHWEILCAMVSGPGDGFLEETGDIDYNRKEIVEYLRYLEKDRYRLDCSFSGEIRKIADAVEQGKYEEDFYEKSVV